MNKTILFLRLPFWKKWLCVEIFFYLCYAKLVISYLHFRIYTKWLGNRHAETLYEAIEPICDQQYLRFLQRFIPTFSQNLPWRSVCLHESLAGFFLLRKKGFPSTLYFGVNKVTENKVTENSLSSTDKDSILHASKLSATQAMTLSAHAWLRCGQSYITGGDGKGFTVVASYAHFQHA